MELKNWFIVTLGNTSIAVGEVFNSPKFTDGDVIRTSLIKSIKGVKITTEYSVYELVGKEYTDIRGKALTLIYLGISVPEYFL